MKVFPYNNIADSLRAMRRHILAVAASVIALSCLCCCHDKNDPIPEIIPDEEVEYISLTLNTKSTNLSRAEDADLTWGSSYTNEVGNNFENKINPEKIHVAVFDRDKNFLRLLSSSDPESKVTLYSVEPTKGLHHIVFNTTGMGIKRDQTYFSMVMVNCDLPDDIDNTSVEIDELTFAMSELAGKNPVAGTNYYNGDIPMFGFAEWKVGDFNFPEEDPAFPSVATVDMIRSVCKIEVFLPTEEQSLIASDLEFNDASKPHLFGVSGKHINQSGFVIPKKEIWSNAALKQSTDLKIIDSYHGKKDRWKSGNANDLNLYLPATIKNEDGKIMGYYIYLPEASGHSMEPYEDALRLNVSVKYTPEGDEERVRIVNGTLFPSIPYDEEHQCYPDDANYNDWRLYRNHIYRFTIKAVSNETSLDYNVSVTGSKTIDVPDFE